jgi:hypothetical protein
MFLGASTKTQRTAQKARATEMVFNDSTGAPLLFVGTCQHATLDSVAWRGRDVSVAARGADDA